MIVYRLFHSGIYVTAACFRPADNRAARFGIYRRIYITGKAHGMELVGIEILEHFAEIGFHHVFHAIHEGEATTIRCNRARISPEPTRYRSVFLPTGQKGTDTAAALPVTSPVRRSTDGATPFQPGFDTDNAPAVSTVNSHLERYLPEELPHGQHDAPYRPPRHPLSPYHPAIRPGQGVASGIVRVVVHCCHTVLNRNVCCRVVTEQLLSVPARTTRPALQPVHAG